MCARPRLAELSGRFLFAIDDGRGDVAALGADVVAVVRGGEASVNGLAVGHWRPVRRGRDADPGAGQSSRGDDRADAIATVMLAFAEAFLDERAGQAAAAPADGLAQGGPAHEGRAWRIADLPGGAGRVRAVVAGRFGLTPAPLSGTPAVPGPGHPGTPSRWHRRSASAGADGGERGRARSG